MSTTTTTTPHPQAGGKLASEHDGFAIGSLVTAFFAPILAIIFGHLSNHRAKLAHRARSGLAVAGLVLGYLFTAVIVLIMVIVVAVAGSTIPSVSANAAPSASSAPASPAAPAASKAPSTMGLAPGHPVTFQDRFLGYHGTVTITGVQVVTGPQTEFGSAPAHGHFVIATVKAIAASGGQLDISLGDFYAKVNGQHISFGDGNAFGAIDSGQELTDSTLNGGETATGQIVFDVPGTHGQIVYAPSLDNQALASWNY